MLSQVINAHGNSIHQSQTEADFHLKGARCHKFHNLEHMTSQNKHDIKNGI